MPETTRLLGQTLSRESREIASVWRQCLRPLGYWGRPSVVRDSECLAAMPETTWLLGQTLSRER